MYANEFVFESNFSNGIYVLSRLSFSLSLPKTDLKNCICLPLKVRKFTLRSAVLILCDSGELHGGALRGRQLPVPRRRSLRRLERHGDVHQLQLHDGDGGRPDSVERGGGGHLGVGEEGARGSCLRWGMVCRSSVWNGGRVCGRSSGVGEDLGVGGGVCV